MKFFLKVKCFCLPSFSVSGTLLLFSSRARFPTALFSAWRIAVALFVPSSDSALLGTSVSLLCLRKFHWASGSWWAATFSSPPAEHPHVSHPSLLLQRGEQWPPRVFPSVTCPLFARYFEDFLIIFGFQKCDYDVPGWGSLFFLLRV